MAQFPSLADLFKVAGLARTVIDALPPGAMNIPPGAKAALDAFYTMADNHGVEPAMPGDVPTIPAAVQAVGIKKPTRRPKKNDPNTI